MVLEEKWKTRVIIIARKKKHDKVQLVTDWFILIEKNVTAKMFSMPVMCYLPLLQA